MARPRKFAQPSKDGSGPHRSRFNMTIRGELKTPALRYCQTINYGLGELLERMLEWRLIQAGYYQPPWLATGTAPELKEPAAPPSESGGRASNSRQPFNA